MVNDFRLQLEVVLDEEKRFQGWIFLQNFPTGPFFSLFLMRKTLSSGQKWFLRPYFPLIGGMFLLRSGLRFSFRPLQVPEPRVRKRPLSPSTVAFSSLSDRALSVLETKITDHFSIQIHPKLVGNMASETTFDP